MSTSFMSHIIPLSSLLLVGSCNQCILACFLWSKNCEHSSSNHHLCCFYSYRPRLSLAEILIFTLMFSHALFMSLLSLKLSKSANLFSDFHPILFPNFQLTLLLETGSFAIKPPCCLFIYRHSFLHFYNHQIMISITVSSPAGLYIEYAWMPSPIYQHVINLILSLPIRRGPGVFMNVSVQEHHTPNI